MKVFARLSAGAAVAAAVAAGLIGTAASSARTTRSSKKSSASSFTLGVVADTGGLNDHGFNHLAYVGELAAHAKLGVKYQVLVSTSSADYVPYLTKEAENGDKLVVAVGFDFTDALGQVAKEFPKTHFAIIDTPAQTIPGKPKNVEGLIFKSQQSGYLVGYLSGLVSKAKGYKTVSTVGGQDIPSVTAYIAGFQAGARAADPKIKLLNAFSNNFADQAPCETLADNQIAQGSKIVFQVAGGCGLGALQAAKQHGVYGIGVDADQGYLGSYILTSALKRVNNAVFQATQDLLHGKFTGGGNLVYDVNNNGTGYGRLNAVAKPYAKQLQKLLAEIKAGKINVPTTMLVK